MFSPVYSPFSFPSLLSLSPLFRHLKVAPPKGFGGSAFSSSAGRTTFAANGHIPWALDYTKMRLRSRLQTHFGVLKAQETCLLAANVVLFLLNEI